jgi:hypothetical protein
MSLESLDARLSSIERVLGLQRLQADVEAASELAGGSHQSINCGSHRSCASLICAAPDETMFR